MSLALFLLLLGSPSFAQEPSPVPVGEVPPENDARARELFGNGRILFEEGRYEDAIAAWEEGYRLSPRPLFLYNIGNAWERLGKLEQALEYLHRYRAFAPAEERTTLERRIRSLETRIAEQPDPEVVPDPEAPDPEPPDPEVVPDPEPPPPPPKVGTESIVLLGVGGAAIAAGTTLGILSLSSGSKAKEQCVEAGGGYLCGEPAQPFVKRQRSQAAAADVSFAVGAACLIGGTLTLLLDAPVTPMPLPGGGGLVVGGRF